MSNMINDLLKQIKDKLAELDTLRPIKPEYMQIISSKFKLDSNYHTNHIEGNTLTIGETNSLILQGLNSSIAKRCRDIEEMRGHIKVYDDIGFITDRILTDDKLPLELTQNIIKNLHKVIFVEDEIKHSTVDGITSITTIPAGNYKIHSNSVITNSGTVFEYADPTQVPSLMSDLLDWYNTARKELNPIILASIFHYKFIRIHPFGDGNGRMARLLMNWILQSSGYSLIIVKSDRNNRDIYLNSLSLTDNNFVDIHSVMSIVDTASFEPFVTEIARLQLESLDLMIRGAKGEDITDVADLIKELAWEAKIVDKDTISFYVIQSNPILLESFVLQKRKITAALQGYVDKVLPELFYKVKFGGIIGDYKLLEIERSEITKAIEGLKIFHKSKSNEELIPGDESRKFIISLIGRKTSPDKFENPQNFNVELQCRACDYEIEKILFFYNDSDFDSKLKQVIQNLNNRIMKHFEEK